MTDSQSQLEIGEGYQLTGEMSLREAVRTRRAVRRFRPEPVPREMILEALGLAHQAPSSYNLQPWSFVVVDDPQRKKRLMVAAMDQPQVERAAAVVVFCADPLAERHNVDAVLAAEVAAGQRDEAQAASTRRYAAMAFNLGPLGVVGLLKWFALPLVRLFRPIPPLPTCKSGLREWAARETMLAAQTFMLAARDLDLDTCPMAAFDEGRVKRLLGIPRRMVVPVLVAVGYGDAGPATAKVRLPLEGKVAWNGWSGRHAGGQV